MMCQKCTKIQKIRLFRKQLFVWSWLRKKKSYTVSQGVSTYSGSL